MSASNICQRLIKTKWRPYATDLAEAPQSEGICAIGFLPGPEPDIYVGRSIHIRTRLQQHKSQNLQAIDEFVKEQFNQNGGKNLAIKWVELENSKCLEGQYLNCIHETLGYWPRYNLKHGNTCN